MKQTVRGAIDEALERGTKIEDLDRKAETLNDESDKFQKGAKRVRRKFCLQKWKMIALVMFIVLLAIGIIVAVLCGSNRCSK